MKTLLLGDVCPSNVTRDAFQRKETGKLFGDFIEVMRSSDFTFVNLECAITDSEAKIKKFGPHLKAPRETAEVLKELGVAVCGLSNNHVFDFGTEGAVDTLKALSSVGIEYTGFGDNYEDARKNYVFEKDGEKIAIVAVCEHEFSGALDNRMGSRTFDICDTLEDIGAAKDYADRVIVCYHGGKEYSKFPSPRLRKVCRAMANAGADVILCQHSHCIGSYEEYADCHILYGQGNFNFVSLMPLECWHSSLAVSYDTKSGELEFIPVVENGYGIELAKGEDEEKILREFGERNSELENGVWLQRWSDFCNDVKDAYIAGVAKAALPDASEEDNALFAQLLNCEAHNDVLCELFKTWNVTNCM
jgi:poly-gamma-glutamate synthesis protein (capsule biosynthesis protein)